VASYRGRRGILRLKKDGATPEPIVAGINLVGLAFDYDDNLIVADSGSLLSVPLGITGKPLP
jgi:hypothetical protein